MRPALIIAIIFLAGSALAQTPEWGLVVSPAYSQGRLPNGVVVIYPGAPLWAGNLKVEERNVQGFAIEIFREQSTKWNRITVKTGLGYLSCGAYKHFDYDYANSFNNIISVENRFRYITFNALAKYSISVKKASVFASLGPHFVYMIYSRETSINYVSDTEVSQGSFNFLSYEKRFNYGPQYTLGGRYQRISVEAFYRSYYRVPYHTAARRIINFGLSLSYYLKGKKTEGK